jgi:4-hydroxybenzoate polyprenyltransferase
VINDYFDVKIDEVNKPRRIIIDRVIPRRGAMVLHQILTGSGIVLAAFVAWQAGSLKLALIHPIVAAFLWFYSTSYKRRLFTGNLIIAFLSGFVILIVALYEQHLFSITESVAVAPAYTIFVIVFFYFLFSFFISLSRELVKDMEDIEGDRKYNCRTVPIVYGISKTKISVYLILGLVMVMLIYFQWMQLNGKDFVSALTIFTTLEFPMLVAIYLLKSAAAPKDFSLVSSVLKIVMFMGILSMVYFYIVMIK